MGQRLPNIAFSAMFLAALVAPVAASVLGVRPERLENRALTEFPALTSEAVSNPDFYAQVTQALIEHNPLRKTAITTVAEAQYRLLKSVPAANVSVGPTGWLFIRESLERPCVDDALRRRSVARFEEWAQSLRAKGKTIVFVVAPDKASIYPEMAPARTSASAHCAYEDNAFWRARAPESTGALDTFSILAQARRQPNAAPIYTPGDTHWTDYGSALVAKAILDTTSPGMLDGAPLRQAGSDVVKPDLSRMSGLYFDENRSYWRWDRPGEQSRSPEAGKGGAFIVQWGISDGARMDDRNILILHDSFFEITWDHLASVYAHPVYVHWNRMQPDDFARRARAADIIIVETVQREATSRMLKFFGPDALVPQAQKAIEQ